MRIALLIPDTYLKYLEYFTPYIVPDPDRGLYWKDTEFTVNPSEGEFEGVVVHQSVLPLSKSFTLKCPKTKTLLVIKEPPDICNFPSAYTKQFNGVISQDTRVQCKESLIMSSGHHWFSEIEYNVIKRKKSWDKNKEISAVVSGKQDTLGHRQRYKFMLKLKEHFGERLDWWGRGVNELQEPKATALLPYKYHIALENGNWPHYWTEKLADCFVSNCVPIYWGPDNITEYFQEKSIIKVDINNPYEAITKIEKNIREDTYEKVQAELACARKMILERYHPFEIYTNVISSFPTEKPKELEIHPHDKFKHTIFDRLRHKRWQLFSRPLKRA